MMRSSVLLPLPLAPSSTNSSPEAISSETPSSTTCEPKRLLMPSTRIDTPASALPLGAPRGAQEQEEDDERQRGQHRRDGVRAREIAGLELGKDVQRRRLRAQPQVARHE